MLSWFFSEPLPVGAQAPAFTLPDQDGAPVSLSSFRGRPVVLIFYPGDDTPVCTRQLCEFRDNWKLVQRTGAVVLGINPSSAGRHARFRGKHEFPFPLLVDKGQGIAALYHANGIWVKRTVYLVDAAGIIRFAARGKPSPNEVLSVFTR